MLAVAVEHPDIVNTLTWVSVGAGFRTDPTKMQARVANCLDDTLSLEYQKCRMVARAPGTRHISSGVQKATDWLWNLPKSVEIRKRLAALRTTGAQKQAEERARAYRERIVEKARSDVLQVPILIYNGKQDVFDWAADAPHADMRGAMEFFDIVGAKNTRRRTIERVAE